MRVIGGQQDVTCDVKLGLLKHIQLLHLRTNSFIRHGSRRLGSSGVGLVGLMVEQKEEEFCWSRPRSSLVLAYWCRVLRCIKFL